MAKDIRSAAGGRYIKVPTKSGRYISADTQRAAAKVSIAASKTAGEPVPQRVKDLAAEAS